MPVDQPAPDTSKTYDLLVPDGIQSPADVTAVSKKRRLTKSTSSSKHKRKCRTQHNQPGFSEKKCFVNSYLTMSAQTGFHDDHCVDTVARHCAILTTPTVTMVAL